MSNTNKTNPINEHRRSLHHARQMWRLCVAAEVMFARMGASATVADIIKQAGMSRRSYYEYFSSREQQVLAMHLAAKNVIEKRLAPQERAKGGSELTIPYVPHADWILLAHRPSASEDINIVAAFQRAREAVRRAKEAPPPAILADDDLLAWAKEMRVSRDAWYEAAQ